MGGGCEATVLNPRSFVTKPVLFAGLLGGLLGGGGGFALTRAFPAPAKPVVVAEPDPHPARALADELIADLKAGRDDAFFGTIRRGFVELNDEQFAQFRQGIEAGRQKFAKDYGTRGDFEFGRETVLSPSVAQFVYVEKYERGCIAYFVVFYQTPGGWRMLAFNVKPMDAAFALLR